MGDFMTDVLLINPGNQAGVYQQLSSAGLTAIEPPVWCRLLGSYLQQQGFTVDIWDVERWGVFGPSELRQRAMSAGLVAVVVHGQQPSASTQKMPAALDLVRELRKAEGPLTPIPIVMVGGHPAALPEMTLRESEANFVCTGEGPVTLAALVRFVKGGKPWQWASKVDVPGIAYWDHGEVVINDPAPNVTDLTTEMPGYTLWNRLDPRDYRCYAHHAWSNNFERSPYASIYTSLGCPYKCLRGDTLINTVYGSIPIKDLAARFTTVPVYTYKDGEVVISNAINIRKTGSRKKLVRVRFTDGSHIDCTPDHKFLTFKWGNGRGLSGKSKEVPVEAQHLVSGARIRAIKTEIRGAGRAVVTWGRRKRKLRARMVMEYLVGRKLLKEEIVHHKDKDCLNDLPDNLMLLASRSEHSKEHGEETATRMRRNNPAKNMTPEWRKKINDAIRGLKRSDESKERYRAAAFRREASKPGRRWWTEPDGSCHLSQQPKDLGAVQGKPKGLRWWTRSDGTTYYDTRPRSVYDTLGRKGFNPRAQVNHVVDYVEWIDGRHDVYCMEVPEYGWFFAGDVLVKNCSFCMIQTPFREGDKLHLKGANSYRLWSPSAVLAEITTLVERYNVKNIRFNDEMFILNPAHVEAVCKLITERFGDSLNLWCYGRVDVTKERYLDMLRRAGVKWICLGIESMSAEVRDGVDKATYGPVDVIRTCRQIQNAGINIIANYMFGLPDDTMESMQYTLALAKELRTEYINFYCVVAYPGSRLFDEALHEGWVPPRDWLAWSFHSYGHEPLGNKDLTPAEVLKFRDEAFVDYYSDASYQRYIAMRFGERAVLEVQNMLRHRLRRRLLGD